MLSQGAPPSSSTHQNNIFSGHGAVGRDCGSNSREQSNSPLRLRACDRTKSIERDNKDSPEPYQQQAAYQPSHVGQHLHEAK